MGDISIVLAALDKLIPDFENKGPGRPPKHSIKEYIKLLVLKECKKSSLRSAETDWSTVVCGERVDHSVIGYWEKNIDPSMLEQAVRAIGRELDEMLGYQFSIIDATSFTNWHKLESGFHVVNRISDETVYPVSVHIDSLDPVPNTSDTIVPGQGLFMGDKWYDVNGVYKLVYKHGYTPLISPQRNRGSGHWRRKARKVYNMQWRRYRQRGRGESIFGSLTNAYGDRMNTRRKRTVFVRSCLRVISYQAKIYIRATCRGNMVIWVNN